MREVNSHFLKIEKIESNDKERKIDRAETGVQDAVGIAARAAVHRGKFAPRRCCGGATGISRRISVYARDLPDDVPQPALDDAAVRGIWDGGGIEQALSLSAEQGTDGLVG